MLFINKQTDGQTDRRTNTIDYITSADRGKRKLVNFNFVNIIIMDNGKAINFTDLEKPSEGQSLLTCVSRNQTTYDTAEGHRGSW